MKALMMYRHGALWPNCSQAEEAATQRLVELDGERARLRTEMNELQRRLEQALVTVAMLLLGVSFSHFFGRCLGTSRPRGSWLRPLGISSARRACPKVVSGGSMSDGGKRQLPISSVVGWASLAASTCSEAFQSA